MILPALVLLSVCCQLSGAEATAEPEIVCSSGPIEAVYSESVILQCHLKPPLDATDKTVKWTRGNDVVLLHQRGKNNPGEQREQFEGRAVLSQERLTKGNLSLELSSLKLTDTGRYKCFFITENLEKGCYVNLTVGESDVIGSDEPVKVNVGQDVILPCHLEPPFNVSTLTVEWKHNNTYVHVYRSRKDDSTNQDNQFKERTSLFHEEMKKGNISLQLRNVTKKDEGLYICHVPKLHSQVKKGNITLIVAAAGSDTKQQTNESRDGSSALIISVTVIPAVIIVIIVLIARFIIWKTSRQNEAQNNQQNNGQEGEQQQDEQHQFLPQQQEPGQLAPNSRGLFSETNL